jgi:hypothetical protein
MIERAEANRLAAMEMADKRFAIVGDFEGSVTGRWVKLANNGGGIVSFNRKEYITKPIGFTSLPAGSEVEMSYANGVYYSKF